MSGKPVVLRDLARNDVDEAIDHYLTEAGATVALAFIDAFEAVLRRIGEQPGSGSPRYALELNLPGLRVLSTDRFPYLIFYVEKESVIDVWRVLHGARDNPVWLHESLEG